MSDSDRSSNRETAKRKLVLDQSEPKEETLVVETEDEGDEVVLSSNTDGSSLTLLEEYSMKNASKGKQAALLAFLCAAASITFAFMIFKTL